MWGLVVIALSVLLLISNETFIGPSKWRMKIVVAKKKIWVFCCCVKFVLLDTKSNTNRYMEIETTWTHVGVFNLLETKTPMANNEAAVPRETL